MRAAKAGKCDKVEKLLKKKAYPNTVEFDSVSQICVICIAVFH